MFDREKKEQNSDLEHNPIKRIEIKKLFYLSKVMPAKERWLVRFLGLIIICSFIGLFFNNYSSHIRFIPKIGGEYSEGILGQPHFANPVFAQTNDADKDIVTLVYSSLFKYGQSGNLIPDLARDYEIEEDGLTYTIFLRDDVVWHDQEPLTAGDVIFTIKTIQNPEYRSPLYSNWRGVEMEKVDDFTIRFKLNNAYAQFLYNLTVGILPKHLWGGISAQNFALAEYNLKPVGSGPYKFKQFTKDNLGQIKTMEFIRNEKFYLADQNKDKFNKPYIEKIVLKFYPNQAALLEAKQKGQINGMNLLSTESRRTAMALNIHEVNLPVYYAVFFNQTENEVLSDKAVRTALSYATNKNEIVEKVLGGKGAVVNSPIPANWTNYGPEGESYDFSEEKARNILEEAGWRDIDGDGKREKGKETEATLLELTLLTTNWQELKETAELLKEQWEKVGARVNIELIDDDVIQQDYIRPRQYQALLFGEALGADPDLFAFWHSSQMKDPGLNLALYKNTDVDKLLEEARQTMDDEQRKQKNIELQQIILDEAPAVFLYSPHYLYPVDRKIKGIDLEKLVQYSYRFSQIENWYIQTGIVWQ